jgi:hypothetical protein
MKMKRLMGSEMERDWTLEIFAAKCCRLFAPRQFHLDFDLVDGTGRLARILIEEMDFPHVPVAVLERFGYRTLAKVGLIGT